MLVLRNSFTDMYLFIYHVFHAAQLELVQDNANIGSCPSSICSTDPTSFLEIWMKSLVLMTLMIWRVLGRSLPRWNRVWTVKPASDTAGQSWGLLRSLYESCRHWHCCGPDQSLVSFLSGPLQTMYYNNLRGRSLHSQNFQLTTTHQKISTLTSEASISVQGAYNLNPTKDFDPCHYWWASPY